MIILNCVVLFVLHTCPTRLKDGVPEPFQGTLQSRKKYRKTHFHLEVPLQTWLIPFWAPGSESPQRSLKATRSSLLGDREEANLAVALSTGSIEFEKSFVSVI